MIYHQKWDTPNQEWVSQRVIYDGTLFNQNPPGGLLFHLEVPDEFKRDYQEACLVLADSPNASAALSRRCLQFILRGKLGAQGKDLYNQIDWAIKSENLSSSIIELLDVPRKIGNRAVHPTLSYAGMIVDVEPWEAEWCLEVIEALYDHIFVIPVRNRERLERLGRALKIGPDDELLENIPRS